MKRRLQFAALALLSGVVLWFGVIPAFTRLDTDFPNYYTASRMMMEGKDLSRLYDDGWFQDQITANGISQLGKFSPFPPVTVFVMIPLAWLPPLDALRAWTVVNIVLVAFSIRLLMKLTNKDWLWCTLLFFGSGLALINNFRFGQFYVILLFLMMSGYYAVQKGRYRMAGIAIGIGAAVKYFPIVVLPQLIADKKWKTVFWTLGTAAILYAITVLLLGVEVHRHFFSSVLTEHLSGNIQNPFSSTFQSYESLLKRLFLYEPELNPSPVFHSAVAYTVIKYMFIAAVVIPAGLTFRRTSALSGIDKIHAQCALLIVTGLLLLPASATYHFLLLVLPLGLLLSGSNDRWNIFEYLILACMIAIGFTPYSFFRPFDGKGIATILAYPRLWLMTAMFITLLFHLHRQTKAIHP